MKSVTSLLLCVLCLPLAGAQDLESGFQKALDAMAGERRHGGWTMKWSVGQSVTWGEFRPVGEHVITAQPPSTPGVGSVFLLAAAVLDDDRYLTIAREARDALMSIQTEHGGFPHEWDARKGPGGYGSFDDGTTTGPLAFFHRLWLYTGADGDRIALESIGRFLLTSQYTNGGWPQAYPLRASGYSRYITMNDNAMPNAIRACLRMYEALGDERYLDAAKRGGDCLITLQGGEGEEVWAQQYDPDTLEPAWARKFEPPGYTPAESIAVCDVLIDLALITNDSKYLEPLPKAFAWYDRVTLPNGKRARLYEPGTGRPVYGRRDKAEKVYDVAQATEGYSWQAEWYPTHAKALYERIESEGMDAVRNSRIVSLEVELAKIESSRSRNEEAALATIGRLNAEGFWTRGPDATERPFLEKEGVAIDTPIIHTRDFVSNSMVVIRALAKTERAMKLLTNP